MITQALTADSMPWATRVSARAIPGIFLHLALHLIPFFYLNPVFLLFFSCTAFFMKYLFPRSPLNGKKLKKIPITSNARIKVMIGKARRAQQVWMALSARQRARILLKLIPLINKRMKRIALTIHREMGKPYWDAVREIESVPESVKFHCLNDPGYLEPITLQKTKTESNIQLFEPMGIVAVITPWNFPFAIPFDGILPSLIAGNAVIFKPSELVTRTGMLVMSIFRELEKHGLPKNLVCFAAGSKETGRFIVKQDIDMVSFVGSRRAGIEIMRDSAGKLHRLILELGGKDPAIVCKDADLEKTAQGIVYGALRNCGQVCCAIERVYVESPVYSEFVRLLVQETKKIKAGAGENADIGPLAAAFQRKVVKEHIEDAVKKGACVLLGGKQPRKPGYWFEPTILVNVNHKMRIMREETFGPVIPVMEARDVNEAIKLANDSIYGLTASVWTRNRAKGKRIARKLVAGTVTVNRRGGVKEGCPWGGAKQSGIGRQMGRESVRSYTEIKHLWIK